MLACLQMVSSPILVLALVAIIHSLAGTLFPDKLNVPEGYASLLILLSAILLLLSQMGEWLLLLAYRPKYLN